MTDTKNKKGGRPVTKTNLFSHPLAHALLKELAQRKATNDECAQRMGVSLNTWKRWKAKNTELWATMGARPTLSDDEIEISLHDSAKGFSKFITKVDKDGNVEVEERYYPPNVAATAFWLKNKKPQQWRDKIDIAASMEQIPVRINFKRKEKVVEAESTIIPERKEIEDGQRIQGDSTSEDRQEEV